MKVVLASQNPHKLREIQTILSEYGMEVVLQSDLGLSIDVDETGETFEANSYLKAKAVLDATGLPTVADDSGLSVDVLGGEPGVYSARYGGAACVTDRDRTNLLLEKLRGVRPDERTARFVCVITMLMPDGEKLVGRGSVEGVITTEPHGEGGFGYDPVFYIPKEGMTYAEMGSERKNQMSHRANALRQLERQLDARKEKGALK